MTGIGLSYQRCPAKARQQALQVSRLAQGPRWQQAEKAALTFRAMFVKWAPQALQLGSEPVGEGKELYPGLE